MNAGRSTCAPQSPAGLRSLSDERLAELARDGSQAAFEVIVGRHRRTLVGQCTHILGEADAEEAVQEALLKAYVAIVRGDQAVRTLDPWLRTVARNTGLTMLRSRGRRPTVPEDDVVASRLTDASAEHRQELQEVLSALASLPARQREAMVLREFEGRSYEEIGARLGATEGAVRQLLNRARSAVRARVGALASFAPALRWFAHSDAGRGVARVGALTGGGAIAAKLCASALPAALLLGSAWPSPDRTAKSPITARVASPHPSTRPKLATAPPPASTSTPLSATHPAVTRARLRAAPPARLAGAPPGRPALAPRNRRAGAKNALMTPPQRPSGLAAGDHRATGPVQGSTPASRGTPIHLGDAPRRTFAVSRPGPTANSHGAITPTGPGVAQAPSAPAPRRPGQ